ncbi:hypothetical protein FJT64_027414 [Amphibalanus amphitrite]|uniref:Uncharacterized protein n=1 Tax=Amphibalanus amphitrite TaxID=1232801 RepID=A0A6A4VVB9_AMPAM|nr:hypothetical protein FJT64_027414 [Amphibalanus amphitrite]
MGQIERQPTINRAVAGGANADRAPDRRLVRWVFVQEVTRRGGGGGASRPPAAAVVVRRDRAVTATGIDRAVATVTRRWRCSEPASAARGRFGNSSG